MKKIINGREIIFESEEIYILQNDADKEHRESVDNSTFFDYCNRITEEYCANSEFSNLHNQVFDGNDSWQMEDWDDEDRDKYIEVRIPAPQNI